MTDLNIYPECPVCWEPDEDGIDVRDMKMQMFLFECDKCGGRSEGFYNPREDEVSWIKIGISAWKWWLFFKPDYWL